MLIYFLLVAAILLEVAGTLLLPATQNFSRIFPTVIMVGCYIGSFFLLTFVIKVLPISIVYATIEMGRTLITNVKRKNEPI